MKSIIVALWLIFGGIILTPVVINYAIGSPYDEVLSIIETEAETEVTQITGEAAEGNRLLLTFTARNDFGVAIFSHYGDNYRYEEGTISNGMDDIDINLDTGWNIYVYKVTADGLHTQDVRTGEGIYRTYTVTGVCLGMITVIALFLGRVKKRKADKRKTGFRHHDR